MREGGGKEGRKGRGEGGEGGGGGRERGGGREIEKKCTSSVAINLNAGTFSSNYVGRSGFAAGANDAIAIALKTVRNVGIGDNQADTLIADSTPGDNDVLIGGTGSDSFTAGAGKDIFVGGGGIDTAIFHDPEADYSITNRASGVWRVRQRIQPN